MSYYAVVGKCSTKESFLKILQNSQENTCSGDFSKKSYRSQACITIYRNNFLRYQSLILLYHFHQKIKTENGSFFKKIETATVGVP